MYNCTSNSKSDWILYSVKLKLITQIFQLCDYFHSDDHLDVFLSFAKKMTGWINYSFFAKLSDWLMSCDGEKNGVWLLHFGVFSLS